MILSDSEIRKRIENKSLIIKPLYDDTIRENGLDLRLGGEIARVKNPNKLFDPIESDIKEFYLIEKGEKFTLMPNESILIHTIEYIKLPSDLIGFINLRSSYARLGLSIPPTIVDAGFEGQLTISLRGGGFKVYLYKGERIIHLILAKTSSPIKNIYKGVYKGQRGIQLPIFKVNPRSLYYRV